MKCVLLFFVLQLYNFEFADEFHSRAYQIKILNTTEALWLSVRDEAKMQLETGLVHLRKKKEKAVIIVHSGGEYIISLSVVQKIADFLGE